MVSEALTVTELELVKEVMLTFCVTVARAMAEAGNGSIRIISIIPNRLIGDKKSKPSSEVVGAFSTFSPASP